MKLQFLILCNCQSFHLGPFSTKRYNFPNFVTDIHSFRNTFTLFNILHSYPLVKLVTQNLSKIIIQRSVNHSYSQIMAIIRIIFIFYILFVIRYIHKFICFLVPFTELKIVYFYKFLFKL